MRAIPSVCLATVAAGLLLLPRSATAQSFLAPPPAGRLSQPDASALQQQIDQLKKEFGERIAALEAKLAEAQAAAPTPAPPPVPVAPAQTAATSGARFFNPDTAVIGNFLGTAGHNEITPSPALEMPESEVSFQAIVDPYMRADFYLAFGEEGVELEEGFATLTDLPGNLQAKAGKMRAMFGKVNTLHRHVLPWADRPLVINNLVGGEEGISDAGISVARLMPIGNVFFEGTGQVFRGDAAEGELFKSSQPGDLSYVGRLRGYFDITESTNLDFGGSYSQGHNAAGIVDDVDVGRFTTQLFGVDATFRWRPLTRAIYRQFVARTEYIRSHRDQFDGLQKAGGFYVSGDYQFARRWWIGARLDQSGRADDASLLDRGQSFLLTFKPTEFSQMRGQYRRTAYGNGPTAHEFLMQFQFAIGAHGAHPF
jgi:hypothetical protein